MSYSDSLNEITPLRTEEPERRRYGVIDIETDGLGGQFIYGGYAVEHEHGMNFFDSIRDFLEQAMSRRYRDVIWFAHNGGGYDYKYFLEDFWIMASSQNAEIFPIIQGLDRVIGFKIKKNKNTFEFRDSYAILPMSLKQVLQSFSPEMLKLDFDHENTRFDPNNTEHLDYLIHDVKGLLQALIKFDEMTMSVFGVHPSWTTAATAYRAWRRTLPEDFSIWRQDPEIESFCREAYFGGMVIPRTIRKIETPSIALDINAHYPSTMRLFGVPTSQATHSTERLPHFGFVKVRAFVPYDIAIPCIPCRIKTGVCWPVGYFETTITTDEMNYAEQFGCKFEIIDAVYFMDIIYPFKEFVDTCEQLRTQHASRSPIGMTVKLMQNSLYGKFGARPEMDRYLLTDQDVDWNEYTPVTDQFTGQPNPYLYVKTEEVQASYMQVHWAAWITAHARITLHKAMMCFDLNDVYYCDTDGIKLSLATFKKHGSVLQIHDKKYGAFKQEEVYQWLQILGPKNYVGLTVDGEKIQKSKGIPLRYLSFEDHQRAASGEKVNFEYTSMNSTLQMIQRHVSFSQIRNRSVSRIENSPHWVVKTDGTIRPITLDKALQICYDTPMIERGKEQRDDSETVDGAGTQITD